MFADFGMEKNKEIINGNVIYFLKLFVAVMGICELLKVKFFLSMGS